MLLVTAKLNNNNTEFDWVGGWVGGFQPIIESNQLLLGYGWVGFWQCGQTNFYLAMIELGFDNRLYYRILFFENEQAVDPWNDPV